MAHENYTLPDHPQETPVDASHTRLLYYACNELLSQRTASKLTSRFDSQPHMYALIPFDEVLHFDDYFEELPHSSPTVGLEHELTLETCTKGWFDQGRFAKKVLDDSGCGYPTISLTIERSRHLASPLGQQFGSFILRSEISYECLGKEGLVMRQVPQVVSHYDLSRGRQYAEVNDQQLWEALYPYWENSQFNRQAVREGRYEDLYFLTSDIEEEPATITEFSTLIGAIAKIKTQ